MACMHIAGVTCDNCRISTGAGGTPWTTITYPPLTGKPETTPLSVSMMVTKVENGYVVDVKTKQWVARDRAEVRTIFDNVLAGL